MSEFHFGKNLTERLFMLLLTREYTVIKFFKKKIISYTEASLVQIAKTQNIEIYTHAARVSGEYFVLCKNKKSINESLKTLAAIIDNKTFLQILLKQSFTLVFLLTGLIGSILLFIINNFFKVRFHSSFLVEIFILIVSLCFYYFSGRHPKNHYFRLYFYIELVFFVFAIFGSWFFSK